MQSILSTNYYVHFQDNAYQSLLAYLTDNFHSKIFILVDNNTQKHCLPILLKKADLRVDIEVIEIEGKKYEHDYSKN